MTKRKLIEVALPLEEINKQSAREKSIRHGHPSTLHLWWARRPLATARAVLFAQLVDDPSNREGEYREEAARKGEADVAAYAELAVQAERQRLFRLIERMVNWDNLSDEVLFDEVRAEILKSTNGKPPAILDPFAGGGTIPLEAQRLGLKAHASDLNPVAVLINKALIEFPPKFAGREPVFPGAAGQRNAWPKATGLAEDVRRYGSWMRDEAEQRIGHLYPKASLADGSKVAVIAWIWARTVTCPNPACFAEVPLVSSLQLGSKRGKERHLAPIVLDGRVDFVIRKGIAETPSNKAAGRGAGFTCWVCAAAIPAAELHRQLDVEFKPRQRLLAVVAAGNRERVYLEPTEQDVLAADVPEPSEESIAAIRQPSRGTFGGNAQGRRWGFFTFKDYFTNRQLIALTTFSDLVPQARERALADARANGQPEGARLEAGGTGNAAYADAVATYLGMGVSRMTDIANSLTRWENTKEQVRNLFGRQAIPMMWDFGEAPPFGKAAGAYEVSLGNLVKALERTPARGEGWAVQADAAATSFSELVVSTDPPYYDNIGYSDLADFFYVWLRRSLRQVHPDLLSTMLVPKSEELVANSYRHGGPDGAREFFEKGFEHVFENARQVASEDYPITVYYAFKQAERVEGGEASTGWETILGAMVRAGWTVTATWPMRSELGNRMIASGANALASSIVLALRPRPEDAPITDRRGFLAELKSLLAESLRELHQGTVAPVDMAQAAIGPGMAIFSKYAKVVQSDGSAMSVHDALVQINAVLDTVRREQEGDFDSDTRWCVAWYEQYGFDSGPFGDAHTLATAKATTVDGLARGGAISNGGGRVKLLSFEELRANYDPRKDDRVSLWEVVLHLGKAVTESGLDVAGNIFAAAVERGFEMTEGKALADLLYALSEKRSLTKSALAFNQLASAWSEIVAASSDAAMRSTISVAPTLDFDSLED